MIARVWHGVTPSSKADQYLDYLNKTGIPDYRATEGNQGVYVLRRIEANRAHFLLLTFWESLDAIKRFAGPDFEKARYYPEDHEYLLEREPTVDHYDIEGKPELCPKSAFAGLLRLQVLRRSTMFIALVPVVLALQRSAICF